MSNQTEHWTPPSTFTRTTSPAIDMLGAEVRGYKVTRRAETRGSQACWELTCQTCGRTRIAIGQTIRDAMHGETVLAACKHDETEDDLSLVQERLDVSPKQAQTLCAVVAHQRAFGGGPRRRALQDFIGREPQTMMLVRRGLLLHTGCPAVITATEKTWKAMRPEDETRT